MTILKQHFLRLLKVSVLAGVLQVVHEQLRMRTSKDPPNHHLHDSDDNYDNRLNNFLHASRSNSQSDPGRRCSGSSLNGL